VAEEFALEIACPAVRINGRVEPLDELLVPISRYANNRAAVVGRGHNALEATAGCMLQCPEQSRVSVVFMRVIRHGVVWSPFE
jgi:hypothetical protein